MEQFREDRDEAYYEKQRDEVETYLKRMVGRYIDVESIKTEAGKEAIIHEAMARYKAGLDYSPAPVGSINGKAGNVILSLMQMGLEDAFTKRTAFNKEFGQEADTACSGDDQRLSDERESFPHGHKIKNVNGLDEMIAGLEIQAARFGHHRHENRPALDKITCSRNTDLSEIETFRHDMLELLSELEIKLAELADIERRYRHQLERTT